MSNGMLYVVQWAIVQPKLMQQCNRFKLTWSSRILKLFPAVFTDEEQSLRLTNFSTFTIPNAAVRERDQALVSRHEVIPLAGFRFGSVSKT